MKKQLYSDLASVCHLFYEQYFPHEKIAERLHRILAQHDCKNIVFIGGLIHVAALLQRKGYKITFVDYTQEMLDEAKRVLKKTPKFLCDMRLLSLPQKYDAILAIGRSFTYMYKDKDALKTLKAFRRHLKPGGIVVIDNYETGKIDRGAYFTGTLYTKNKGIGIQRISTIRQQKQTPRIYAWDCLYKQQSDGIGITASDKKHLLRSFDKEEMRKLIEQSGLKFVKHSANFEKRSFISIARNQRIRGNHIHVIPAKAGMTCVPTALTPAFPA